MVFEDIQTNEIMDMIQSPRRTKRPKVPKVLKCPRKIGSPNENKNKKGISKNKKTAIIQNALGNRPKSKR